MRTVWSAWTCFLPAFAALAQTDRGAITGTVQDPAGAMVPGAVVIARHTANASTRFHWIGSTNGAVGGIGTVLSFMTLLPGVGGSDTNARVKYVF